MTICLSPEAEALRLDALHRLNLLDTAPSENFDRISRMAARLFALPIAAVSLTDRDRQWFKSRVGVDHSSIPRERAPCAAVAESADVVILRDLLADSVYSDSLLAQQGVRFYAGAPLVTRDGHGLGALCVLGTQPRDISHDEIVSLRDLAAMVMAQIELQHAFGRVDPVSALPNRTQFMEDLEDLAREFAGEQRAAILVDLAPPDRINDGLRVLGPRFLDDLLAHAIPRVRKALEPATVYHVSTYQFATIVAAPDPGFLAEFLIARLAAARTGSGSPSLASTAIGMFPFVLGASSPEAVLRSAYAAALDARSSASKLAIHSPASDAAHQRRHRLLDDFARALAAPDELRLVVQPRVDLASGLRVGGEALLRWQHPRLGNVPPAEFIPIIEQSALARPLTQWVLERTVATLREGHGLVPGSHLSVNISAANLVEDDLASRLSALLTLAGVDPAMLELEITESAALADKECGAARLRELASLGVSIAIDDFGTGHSNLAYLQELPAHIVKIDRAFVSRIRDPRGQTLLGATVALLRGLGLRVVAEGVEDQFAADLLRAMTCQEAQGFHFGLPLELDSWAKLLPHTVAALECRGSDLQERVTGG